MKLFFSKEWFLCSLEGLRYTESGCASFVKTPPSTLLCTELIMNQMPWRCVYTGVLPTSSETTLSPRKLGKEEQNERSRIALFFFSVKMSCHSALRACVFKTCKILKLLEQNSSQSKPSYSGSSRCKAQPISKGATKLYEVGCTMPSCLCLWF